MNNYKRTNIVLWIILAIMVVALVATAIVAFQLAEANTKWQYFTRQACYSTGSTKISCDLGIDAVEHMSLEEIKLLYENMR